MVGTVTLRRTGMLTSGAESAVLPHLVATIFLPSVMFMFDGARHTGETFTVIKQN